MKKQQSVLRYRFVEGLLLRVHRNVELSGGVSRPLGRLVRVELQLLDWSTLESGQLVGEIE